MLNISEQLDKYILNHTEPESEVLAELNRYTNAKVLHPRMLSGHLQGRLLALFSKLLSPVNILEIGTYTGYSAICMAEGLAEGGMLHTIEKNDELKHISDQFFKKAGLNHKITTYTGNALDIIPKLDPNFELVFLDGEKTEYLDYYKLVFKKVVSGGLIIADNVLWSGKVIEPANTSDESTTAVKEFNEFVSNDTTVENILLPVRDGLMVMRKK